MLIKVLNVLINTLFDYFLLQPYEAGYHFVHFDKKLNTFSISIFETDRNQSKALAPTPHCPFLCYIYL